MTRIPVIASLAITALCGPALAQQNYPDKPIRMIVPYAAGGAADITARIVGQKMSEGLGVPVVIDNRGGANGNIGTDAVAKASESLGHTFDIVDKALAHQDYLGGKMFSLADIDWMPYVQYLFSAKAGNLVTDRKHLGAWWQRVSTRPSWVKVSA